MQRISQRVLRLSLSGVLFALLVLLTFNVGTTYAAACGSASDPVINTAGISCDIAANIIPGTGDLTYTTNTPILHLTNGPSTGLPSGSTRGILTGSGDGNVAGTGAGPYTYTLNGSSQTFTISPFVTTVTDARGGASGWKLSAAAANFPSASAISLSSTTACQADTGNCAGTAPAATGPTILPMTLSQASNGTSGIYVVTTIGTLTLPNTVTAGTNIAGVLTITLATLL